MALTLSFPQTGVIDDQLILSKIFTEASAYPHIRASTPVNDQGHSRLHTVPCTALEVCRNHTNLMFDNPYLVSLQSGKTVKQTVKPANRSAN